MTGSVLTKTGNPESLRAAWIPAATVLGVMAASKVLYNLPWWELAAPLHKPAAFCFGILLSMAIGLGPSVVYPLGRVRGASPRACVLPCLLTPIAWNLWEIVRLTTYFSVAESLYYGLNSVFLSALAFAAFQMGLWEAILRMRRRRRGEIASLTGPVFTALTGLILVYATTFWAMGQHWFYVYQSGYKALFL